MQSRGAGFIKRYFAGLTLLPCAPPIWQVGMKFKGQLADLMAKLNTTEPHYVRCIKPNGLNKPSQFENANVLHQLRCGGVLEAIRISCAGYPSRRPVDEFVDRFGLLAPSLLAAAMHGERSGDGSLSAAEKALVGAICERAQLQGWQLGLTKVFLRAGQMAVLDGLRTAALNAAATRLQQYVRRHLARARFLAVRAAALRLQAVGRGMIARRLAQRIREDRASRRIQARFRGHLAVVRYQRIRKAVLTIQAAARGRAARLRMRDMRKEQAAARIQATWRMYCVHRDYCMLVHGVTLAQACWRRLCAKRELRRLRQEAREVGSILKQKSELEKKLELEKMRAEAERRRITELESRAEAEAAAREREVAAARDAHQAEVAALREQVAAALRAKDEEHQLAAKLQEEALRVRCRLPSPLFSFFPSSRILSSLVRHPVLCAQGAVALRCDACGGARRCRCE